MLAYSKQRVTLKKIRSKYALIMFNLSLILHFVKMQKFKMF